MGNMQRDVARLGCIRRKQSRKEHEDLEATLSNITWLSRIRPKAQRLLWQRLAANLQDSGLTFLSFLFLPLLLLSLITGNLALRVLYTLSSCECLRRVSFSISAPTWW